MPSTRARRTHERRNACHGLAVGRQRRVEIETCRVESQPRLRSPRRAIGRWRTGERAGWWGSCLLNNLLLPPIHARTHACNTTAARRSSTHSQRPERRSMCKRVGLTCLLCSAGLLPTSGARRSVTAGLGHGSAMLQGRMLVGTLVLSLRLWIVRLSRSCPGLSCYARWL